MSKWEDKTLPQLADFINGYAFKPSDWSKEGLPIIRIEQLKNPETSYDYYSGCLPSRNLIENGDLIFSWSASLFLRFWKNGKAALNQHLFKVVSFDEVDKFFLKYLIEYNLPELLKAAHGSTMQHITRKELNKFRVTLPIEKTDQTKIAAVLSSIDKAIEQTERLIEKQKRIKRGLLHDLLTKGIDAGGAIRSEATHEFKDSPLGRIPKDWEIYSLKQLTTVIVDGIHHTPKYVESGVPFITISDMTKGDGIDFSNTRYITKEDHNSFKKRVLPKVSDVLVTKDGTLGKARMVLKEYPEFSIFVSVALLRPNNSLCIPELIWNFFDSNKFEGQIGELSAGTGLKHIHLEHFNKFLVTTPPVNEQKRIFKEARKVLASLKIEKEKLAKLRVLKTGLMQDLLTENAESRISNLL